MMKNLKLVLGALAIVFAISTVSFAQDKGKSDPKQDKKALKKELKRYKKMKPIAPNNAYFRFPCSLSLILLA